MKNDKHRRVKLILKVIGGAATVGGVVLLLCGTIPFFKGNTDHFYLNFIGCPVLFVGLSCLIFGFSGEMNRYMAEEHKPIAKDVANYMIDGTRGEIVKTAREIRGERAPVCPACGKVNEAGARFCDNCGKPLAKKCERCGEMNDGDANFCRNCGEKL